MWVAHPRPTGDREQVAGGLVKVGKGLPMCACFNPVSPTWGWSEV